MACKDEIEISASLPPGTKLPQDSFVDRAYFWLTVAYGMLQGQSLNLYYREKNVGDKSPKPLPKSSVNFSHPDSPSAELQPDSLNDSFTALHPSECMGTEAQQAAPGMPYPFSASAESISPGSWIRHPLEQPHPVQQLQPRDRPPALHTGPSQQGQPARSAAAMDEKRKGAAQSYEQPSLQPIMCLAASPQQPLNVAASVDRDGQVLLDPLRNSFAQSAEEQAATVWVRKALGDESLSKARPTSLPPGIKMSPEPRISVADSGSKATGSTSFAATTIPGVSNPVPVRALDQRGDGPAISPHPKGAEIAPLRIFSLRPNSAPARDQAMPQKFWNAVELLPDLESAGSSPGGSANAPAALPATLETLAGTPLLERALKAQYLGSESKSALSGDTRPELVGSAGEDQLWHLM